MINLAKNAFVFQSNMNNNNFYYFIDGISCRPLRKKVEYYYDQNLPKCRKTS